VYGEVGWRVGGTGFGAGAAVQQSLDYNFKYNSLSITTSEMAYTSFGPLTIGGNLSQSYNMTSYQWSYGWGVSAGLGIGNDKGGIGINVSYGSGGWSYGIGGSYYTDYERAYMRADARNRMAIEQAFENHEALINQQEEGAYGPWAGCIKNYYPNTTIEGVPIIQSSLLTEYSAFTVPGVGIYAHPYVAHDLDLLRHEFGHILQARMWGNNFYYTEIVPASVKSYRLSLKYPQYNHSETWTEWTANRLSYNYFGQPKNWDFDFYPISPGTSFRPPIDPGRYSPFFWVNNIGINVITIKR
jgi:hypothetical protein